MPRMTMADFIAHQAKHGPKAVPSQSKACEQEWKLRDEILEYCATRWPRWKVIWSRDDKKTTTELGVPDLIVCASNSRVFFMELKSKTGKQRPEQVVWQFEIENLGHNYKVIRSMQEFLSAVKCSNPNPNVPS